MKCLAQKDIKYLAQMMSKHSKHELVLCLCLGSCENQRHMAKINFKPRPKALVVR